MLTRRHVLAGITGVQATGGFAGDAFSDEDRDDTEEETAVDQSRLPTGVTIAWITDRFVQIHGSDAPVVGHEIQTTGMVLELAGSAGDVTLMRERFAWDRFDYTGQDAFSELLRAATWPLAEEPSFPDGFFDDYALAWLSGVAGDYYRNEITADPNGNRSMPSDRFFYELYGVSPLMFAVVPRGQLPNAGSIVHLSATVSHTGITDSILGANDGGGYLVIEDIHSDVEFRTPENQWHIGDSAGFVGVQEHRDPRLTTGASDVVYQDDFHRPKGGSVVAKHGEATGVDRGDGDEHERLELDTDQREILVGDTLPRTWDDEAPADDTTDDESDPPAPEAVNIVLVIDTSGSMEERDTGRERNGVPLTRLEAVQEDLETMLDLTEDGNRIGVVEFNTNAHVVEGLTVIDTSAREHLKDRVQSLNEGGWTTIGGGLQRGMELLHGERGTRTIVLLSDGAENEPPMVDDVLPAIRNEGIRVHSIGIGQGIDEEQLEYIADQTGGEALLDPTVEDLREFYFFIAGDAQQRASLSSREDQLGVGDEMEDDCSVDASCEDVQFSLSYEGSQMQLHVETPDGDVLSEQMAGVTRREGAAHEVWTVEDPDPGDWEYSVEVLDVDAPQQTFMQATANSAVDGRLFATDALYEATGYVRLQLVVTQDVRRYVGATARAEIIPPSGDAEEIEEVALYDDGSGPDDVPNDGIYSNYFHPTEIGTYQVTTVVEGGDIEGFRRRYRHTIDIDSVIDEPVEPWEDRSAPPPREEGREPTPEDPTALDAVFDHAHYIGGGAIALLGAGAWLWHRSRDAEPASSDEPAELSSQHDDSTVPDSPDPPTSTPDEERDDR